MAYFGPRQLLIILLLFANAKSFAFIYNSNGRPMTTADLNRFYGIPQGYAPQASPPVMAPYYGNGNAYGYGTQPHFPQPRVGQGYPAQYSQWQYAQAQQMQAAQMAQAQAAQRQYLQAQYEYALAQHARGYYDYSAYQQALSSYTQAYPQHYPQPYSQPYVLPTFPSQEASWLPPARGRPQDYCANCGTAAISHNPHAAMVAVAAVGLAVAASSNRGRQLPYSDGSCENIMDRRTLQKGPIGDYLYDYMKDNYGEEFTGSRYSSTPVSSYMRSYCPGFDGMRPEQKLNAWVYWFTAVAAPESSCTVNIPHRRSLVPGWGLWAAETSSSYRRRQGRLDECVRGDIRRYETQVICAVSTMASAPSGAYWSTRRMAGNRMANFPGCYR
jgi:hypothetical protein